MPIKIKINLDNIFGYSGTDTFSNVVFDNVVESENVNALGCYRFVIDSLTSSSGSFKNYFEETLTLYTTFTKLSIRGLSLSNTYIILKCDLPSDISVVQKLLNNNLISFDIQGLTTLWLYKQNDENDKLSKSLTFVDIIQGKFNHSIGLKTINIDVINYSLNYNYVYYPKLNRYYYVDSIELVSADYTRLHLKEDVLMSWATLIKSQSAFVTRYENSTETALVDNRFPLEDKLTLEELSVTDTGTGSLVNCTLNFNLTYTKPNIMIVSLSTIFSDSVYRDVEAPTGSGLPDIATHLNNWEFVRFISRDELFYLAKAYRSDDTISSYIESVLWLPFDATSTFDLSTTSTTAIYAKNKFINDNGVYANYDSSDTPLKSWEPSLHYNGACPYLIIKDFTFPTITKFYEREPYANYEMYIPFVGWVKIESSKLSGKRILVYYTMDIQSGISTAYIYNYTDEFVVWSGTCQIGLKLDLTTTNQIENIKQKQSNDLNMILGLLSSAVSIGVGVATENPVAMVGGILSAGKTIASNVNANNMIFERAQTSFGTSDGALHSNDYVFIRVAYHNPLITDDNATFLHLHGKPYNQYVSTMSTMSGYVEIGDIHFDPMNNGIYQDEIDEIVRLLQNGVVF